MNRKKLFLLLSVFTLFFYFFPFQAGAESLSIEELIDSKEVSIEEVQKEQERAQEGMKEPEKESEEGIEGFLKKYFEDFDNLKLLVTITFPSALFLAAVASMESLAEERYKYKQRQLNRIGSLASKLNRELEDLDTKLKLSVEERKSLAEILRKGGVIRKQPIDHFLRERERWLERLGEVKRALSEKFYGGRKLW